MGTSGVIWHHKVPPFGTVALRERQHLAMAGSRHLHFPRNATAHCAARANYHIPQCNVLAEVDVRTCRLLTTGTVTRCIRWIRRLRFLGSSTQPGCTVLGPYCLFETSSLTRLTVDDESYSLCRSLRNPISSGSQCRPRLNRPENRPEQLRTSVLLADLYQFR